VKIVLTQYGGETAIVLSQAGAVSRTAVMGLRGETGPQGPPGDDGAPGPAPSGTGLVSVTGGVLDTPTTLIDRLTAEAAAARSAIGAASTASGLSQFPAASTTSDQLAAVLSDETGTGGFVRATSPTIASPTLTGAVTFAGGGNANFALGGNGGTYGVVFSANNTRIVGQHITGILLADTSQISWFNSASSSAFAGSTNLGLSHSGSTLTINQGAYGSGLGNLNLGLLNVGTYTVATLPSASANAGAFAQVTDSNSTTNGAIVAAGGSTRVPVFSDGTNWIIK
jgi:hypothetical protein